LPGTYHAGAFTGDALHAPGKQADQIYEQVTFEFLDAKGNVVAVTGLTDDIPTEDYTIFTDLGGGIVVPDGVVAVRAQHRAIGNLNSVQPQCLFLDPERPNTPEGSELPAGAIAVARKEEVATAPKQADGQTDDEGDQQVQEPLTPKEKVLPEEIGGADEPIVVEAEAASEAEEEVVEEATTEETTETAAADQVTGELAE
jgi:hypothetical protein